jgi:hypothetical protein
MMTMDPVASGSDCPSKENIDLLFLLKDKLLQTMAVSKKSAKPPVGKADEIGDASDQVLAGSMGQAHSGYYKTAGVRLPGYGIQGGLQKFRGNFDLLTLNKKLSLARWLATYNWFVAPVIALRAGVVTDGFTFAGQPARDWVRQDADVRVQSGAASYDFGSIVRDITLEFLTTENVVVLWRKGIAFPYVEVLDAEDVSYKCDGGVESICLSFKRIPKKELPSKDRQLVMAETYGQALLRVMVGGGTHEVIQGQDDDYEFLSLSRGKRQDQFVAPSVLSIVDDLDFIELVKVGDWNGAYARRNIVRQMKKGTEVRTSDAAAIKAASATVAQIKAMKEKLAEMEGNTDLSSNHDVEVLWKTFAPEFFGKEGEITYSARQRIMGWGSWGAASVMQGFSQVRGNRGDMSRMMRADVLGVREVLVPFISSLFNHPEFMLPADSPNLSVEFSDRLLYDAEELNALARTLTSTGLGSFQLVREKLFGLDSAEESALNIAAAEASQGFKPPFEPKQGLLSLGGDGAVGSKGSGDGPGRPSGVSGEGVAE